VAAQAVNRAEFVKLVQQKTEVSQSRRISEMSPQEVEEVVKAMFDTVVDTVAKGDTVTITGFGKFERR
jgi:nucleoid DNA-binding protein